VRGVWVVEKIECITSNKLDCTPTQTDPFWQRYTFDFITFQIRCFRANDFLTALEFSLVMNIGAVMMLAIGSLAVEMRQSVRNILEHRETCFFGAHCSRRCNLWSLYILTGTFFTVSLIYCAVSFVDII